MSAIDEHAATELKLFIDNDYDLHRQQQVPIFKNLATKKVRSQYKHDLAVKLFGYLVESGAKKYAKAFSVGTDWHKMFPVPTRKAVAEELTRDFEGEFELGNYDDLLPKKYQQELAKKHLLRPHAHALKKSSSSHHATIGARDIREFNGFLRNATDRQVQGIYEKEKSAGRDEYAELAIAEASRRGISLDDDDRYGHARKKTSAQLNREIAHVLSSGRGGK